MDPPASVRLGYIQHKLSCRVDQVSKLGDYRTTQRRWRRFREWALPSVIFAYPGSHRLVGSDVPNRRRFANATAQKYPPTKPPADKISVEYHIARSETVPPRDCPGEGRRTVMKPAQSATAIPNRPQVKQNFRRGHMRGLAKIATSGNVALATNAAMPTSQAAVRGKKINRRGAKGKTTAAPNKPVIPASGETRMAAPRSRALVGQRPVS